MSSPSPSEGELVICERSTGTWNYHLRRVGPDGLHLGGGELTALCGETMTAWDTQIPLQTWGLRDHIPATWCRKCAEAAGFPHSVYPFK